jgi:hypothetical protein
MRHAIIIRQCVPDFALVSKREAKMRRQFVDIGLLFKHTGPAQQNFDDNYVKRVKKCRNFASYMRQQQAKWTRNG